MSVQGSPDRTREPQEGHPTGDQMQAAEEPHSGATAQGEADRLEQRPERVGAPSIGGHQWWEPLAEDAAQPVGEQRAEARREHV